MAQRKHEPGPLMDLANMRRQGVRSLIACCLNDACRHSALSTCRAIRPTPMSLVRSQGEMRQVRRTPQPDRRAAELEREAGHA
jgi:hypothetical protein